MDAVTTVAPAVGVAGTLALVIGYLLRSNATDRRDFQAVIDKAQKRTDDMANRVTLAQLALDEQRQLRRQAEDLLDESERKLADLRRRDIRGVQ